MVTTKNQIAVYFYKKTSYKIMLPALVATVGLIIIQVLLNAIGKKPALYELNGLITGNFFNLWYIVMLFGLYALTPLLMLLRESISWKTYKIVSVMLLVWSILSQMTSTQIASYTIGVIVAFIAYYCIGDVIMQEIHRLKSRSILILRLFLSVFSVIAITVAFIARKNGLYYYIENAYTNFFSPMVVIFSICIFAFFGTISIRKSTQRLSEITFYVYLVHTLIMIVLYQIIERFQIQEGLCYLFLSIGTILIAFVVGWLFKTVWEALTRRIGLKTKWYNLSIWGKL